MNIGQAVIEALESLTANKLRSSLTILGIVIGVAAVIAMLAVGTGAQDQITGTINGIGSNLVFVFSFRDENTRNPKPLTLSDTQALTDQSVAPSIKIVSPVVQSRNTVTYGGEKVTINISGINPEYLTMRNYEITEGEFITSEQVLSRASVALIGPETADKLFGRKDGITGETIRIQGQPFRVLGVLASRGGGMGGSEDNTIIVPFSTLRDRLSRGSRQDAVDTIFVEAISAEAVQTATEEITEILRSRHHTLPGADDFSVYSQQQILSTVSTITGVLTIFLGGIAGISLLVGGIGIMNIMLVSVSERTREIGLRKALGARKRDILIQFLTESSMLSLFGGLIGIGLGWLISLVVKAIAQANNTPFSPNITLDAILLATLFATAVGLFFGIYPANRAANLEPVEALRSE